MPVFRTDLKAIGNLFLTNGHIEVKVDLEAVSQKLEKRWQKKLLMVIVLLAATHKAGRIVILDC